MERMTLKLRDDCAEMQAKLDDLALDVKDAQGSVKIQQKMFDNQASFMVSRLSYIFATKLFFCRAPISPTIPAVSSCGSR